eukprot:6869411-Pyramimonas_sp.AAC.1
MMQFGLAAPLPRTTLSLPETSKSGGFGWGRASACCDATVDVGSRVGLSRRARPRLEQEETMETSKLDLS